MTFIYRRRGKRGDGRSGKIAWDRYSPDGPNVNCTCYGLAPGQCEARKERLALRYQRDRSHSVDSARDRYSPDGLNVNCTCYGLAPGQCEARKERLALRYQRDQDRSADPARNLH